MWVFNVLLYLCFLFNQFVYDQLVKQGAPCYGYVASLGNEPADQPPVCFYDPK